MKYLVRDDSYFCTGKPQPEFVNKFCKLLQNYIPMEVLCFDARQQIDYIKILTPKLHLAWQLYGQQLNEFKIVSLDKWFLGDFNFSISRIFEKGTDQTSPIGFHTPNILQFKEWLKSQTDEIAIVDDDISTGRTMKFVDDIIFECTGKHVKTKLSMERIYNDKCDIYDVVDIRDFIPGAKHGGLLCQVDGQLKRIPYIHPDVNLCSRMKLTHYAAVNFSRELVKLQKEIQ